ncbi:MAG: nucleoside-diphosphate-sugar epimerase [Ilumatobacteraceae bacterium]|nr:nucleoside-diphosphate-sugar epimerase [Ilumatobacteraceae bacterium]
MDQLTGKKILVTGVTGWVAGPVATALAANGNTVYGAARLKDASKREPLEVAGVKTISIDLAKQRFDEVPDDIDVVLHFAVAKTQDFELAFAANADGSAALMEKCQGAEAFLHCSSTAVYEPNGHVPLRETDPLGDSHRPMPGMTTYSISKIAGEVMVKNMAKRVGVPTVIARLSVPYGDLYGWMTFHLMMLEHKMPIAVHTDQPTNYAPIHSDDLIRSIPYLLSLASVPATIVNWGGDEVAGVEDWCDELGRLTGLTPTYEPTTATIAAIIPDLEKLHSTGFHTTIGWKEGIRRQLTATRPDLVKQ